jgi:MarR family transcriptional regulator, transcriptional regulator for hemolysin
MSPQAPAPDTLVTPEDEIAFMMEEISRTLRRAFERRIQATGLSRTQWRIIVYVLRAEGMTQTELARALELERATVGQAIDRLEERRFVERRMCASDRRVWRVHASGAATRLVPRLRAEADALYDVMWAGTSRDDFEAFQALLRGMVARLARIDATADTPSLEDALGSCHPPPHTR